ncbi:MAG: hypothetical protein QME96_09480, partial [Myxococcota bacterium]|nr:hypothetical protein [Myxococcota bacterium]
AALSAGPPRPVEPVPAAPIEPVPAAPVEAAAAAGPPKTPHPTAGREDCLMCHKTGGPKPYPADHEGRANAACLGCHPAQ